MIKITERGYRDSCLGRVLQLKLWSDDHRELYWHEAWEAFVQHYPNMWAVQMFPPSQMGLGSKNVYHLFASEQCPEGLNLR